MKGYKILTNDLMSPTSPSKVQYSKDWTTPPSWLHGPLTVYETFDDAIDRVSPAFQKRLRIWEVEYVQEPDNSRWMAWYPKQDPDGDIRPQKEFAHPRGTDFARAVRLLRRIRLPYE